MFCAGAAAAAAQCVYIREYFSILAGNELTLGLILSLWLAAAAAGGFSGARFRGPATGAWLALFAVAAVAGFVGIRGARLLFAPGESIPPAWVPALLLITETPFAFVNGLLFARLSAVSTAAAVYGSDNAGMVAGALLAFGGFLTGMPNAFVLAAACLPLIAVPVSRPVPRALTAFALIACLFIDNPSLSWKYHGAASRVLAGRQGEIAFVPHGMDTTILLNGTVYRSPLDKPVAEQAVHMPMAQRTHARAALVIGDRGEPAELTKYAGLRVDVIESEPLLARAGVTVTSPELYHPHMLYDMIILSAGMPENIAEGRFYSLGFFRRMKSMMTDSGVLAFTLPLSANYLSPSENRLAGTVRLTLRAAFRSVFVFPGEGYTFMASDAPLSSTARPVVATSYLAPFILSSVDSARIAAANGPMQAAALCTADRPIVLALGISRWTEMWQLPLSIFAGGLAVLLIAGIIIFPRRRAMLSIGTSGCAIGAYSIMLMLLFQANCGALYSRVALLLMTLSLGFALGSRIRRLPHADLLIALYIAATILLLSIAPHPALFYCAHLGIGVLGGAQFVSLRNERAGMLYAADLFGGIFGMAITAAMVVPIYGITLTAIGAGVVKSGAWAVGMRARGND